MKKILLLMCAMAVMTATKVQADIISKDALNQSKLKNLWGSLKDAVGPESKKKTKKGDEKALSPHGCQNERIDLH